MPTCARMKVKSKNTMCGLFHLADTQGCTATKLPPDKIRIACKTSLTAAIYLRCAMVDNR
eukprot:scaffold628_cov401-Prasinococcus_capsulatus_cf.AAC.4